MQLLMRRPETDGFISVSPPTNAYDFSFLAPCPASGLILHGSADSVVPPVEVERWSPSCAPRRASPSPKTVEGASHFFDPGMEEMIGTVDAYVRRRLGETSR